MARTARVHARRFRVSVVALFLVAWSSLALAQKTDVVELTNGDSITGEVKRKLRSVASGIRRLKLKSPGPYMLPHLITQTGRP